MRSIPTFRNAGGLLQTTLISLALVCTSCAKPRQRSIAVIPRTTGVQLWEAEHAGAEAAARKYGVTIRWNAPTREDDVDKQIAMVEQASEAGYDGIVLAPDQALALMTPVRVALGKGIRVAVVASPMPLEPNSNLHYIINDDHLAGALAARRIGKLLNGHGDVAVLGIDVQITSILDQEQSFAETLGSEFSNIRIVEERPGAFNRAQAQQTATDTLSAHPHLAAIFALTAAATQGAYAAIRDEGRQEVKLVGCEQDLASPVRNGEIDSLIIENTYDMGFKAVEWIAQGRNGYTPPTEKLRPLLLTKENFNSPETQRLLTLNWREP